MLPQQLFLDEPWTVHNSNFNPNHPTVFYVHGFTERAMGASGRTIKDGKVDSIIESAFYSFRTATKFIGNLEKAYNVVRISFT